jgi:serine/threonine protein kinase
MDCINGYDLHPSPVEGGFGRVFLATRVDQPGVYFVIKTPRDPNNALHRKALEREEKVCRAVNHPNLISLVEVNMEHNPPYIVMKYHPGGSVRDQMNKGLSCEMAILALYQVSGALSAIHGRGGFHRDIKPDNILLSAEGSFILADAGLANVPTTGSSFTHTVMGTPGYIDPHVVNQPYDWAADIWSLGVTFGEMVTNKRPREIADISGLRLQLKDINAANDATSQSIYRLLQATLSSNRNIRPSAGTVQQYASALLEGGKLPEIAPLPDCQNIQIMVNDVDRIIKTTLACVLIVGLAAFLLKE